MVYNPIELEFHHQYRRRELAESMKQVRHDGLSLRSGMGHLLARTGRWMATLGARLEQEPAHLSLAPVAVTRSSRRR